MVSEFLDFAFLRIFMPFSLFLAAFLRYNGFSFVYLCFLLFAPLLKRCKTAIEEISIRTYLIALFSLSSLFTTLNVVFVIFIPAVSQNSTSLLLTNCSIYWSSWNNILQQIGFQKVNRMHLRHAFRLLFPDSMLAILSGIILGWHFYRAKLAATEPLLLESVSTRSHSRQPSYATYHQNRQQKVWRAWVRDYCSGLLLVSLTGIAAVMSPSLLALPYLLVYLGVCTSWSCRCRHIALHVSYARVALLLYSGIHVLLYYFYQFPFFQYVIPDDSKISGLLGLHYILQMNCTRPGEVIFAQRRWIDYAAPLVTLLLCFVMGIETRTWCDTININNPIKVIAYIRQRLRHHRLSQFQSARPRTLSTSVDIPLKKCHRRMASDDHNARLLEVSYLPATVEMQELEYGNAANELHENTPASWNANNATATTKFTHHKHSSNRNHLVVPSVNHPTSTASFNNNRDRNDFEGVANPLHESVPPVSIIDPNISTDTIHEEDHEHQNDTAPSTTVITNRPLILSMLHAIVRNSYILSLIVMMSWSVAYPTWLTFGLLIMAFALWARPNCRQACLYLSPISAIYGVILILIQYISSLNEADLPVQNPEYGMQRVEIPTGALMAQLWFLVPFWLTLRLFMTERAKKNGQLMTAFEMEYEAFSFAFVPPDVGSTSTVHLAGTPFLDEDHRFYQKILRIMKAFCIRCWLILCCAAMLFESIMQPVVIFRIGYMILLLYFLAAFMLNYKFWRKQMLIFWWVAIVYSMIVLLCIYTYQFRFVPEYWHNYTKLSNSTLSDIGLEKFQSATLLHRLLTPMGFIVVIMVQIHYCHEPFLQISKLDRYRTPARDPENDQNGEVAVTINANNVDAGDNSDSSSVSTGMTAASDFMEDVNIAIHTVYKKVYQFFRSSYITLWRLFEVHWSKVLWTTVMVHCIVEVSMFNFGLVILLTICLPFSSMKRFFHISVLLWGGFTLLLKMVYQLRLVGSPFFTYCQSANHTNESHYGNMEKWIGLHKSTAFISDNITGILVIVAAAINHTIVTHQKQFYNSPSHHEPLPGIIFFSITKNTIDHTIVNFIKYLLNFTFYKSGLELCFCMTVITGCLRVDCYSVLYLVLMMLFLFSPRQFCARMWLPYCIVLGALIPFQYFCCVGLPPFLCFDYPWQSKLHQMPQALQQWLFLPSYNLPPVSNRLLGDFFQYLFVCLQYRVFCLEKKYEAEYGGGSNQPILTNSLPSRTTKDFISTKDSYMDYIKHFIFYWFYWISLVIVFITGVTWITLFCLGYMIISFIYFWLGQNIFLRKRRQLIRSWNLVVGYTFFVILAKASLQLVGCLYMDSPWIKRWSWFIQIFGIQCMDPLSLNVFEPPKSSELEISGLHWDVICFIVIILQRKLFMTRSFSFVVIDLKVQSKFASRGAFLINRKLVRVITQQQQKEVKSIEKVRAKVEKIRLRQEALGKNTPDVKEHYLVLRSGDHYLFYGDPEEEDLVMGEVNTRKQGASGTLDSNFSQTDVPDQMEGQVPYFEGIEMLGSQENGAQLRRRRLTSDNINPIQTSSSFINGALGSMFFSNSCTASPQINRVHSLGNSTSVIRSTSMTGGTQSSKEPVLPGSASMSTFSIHAAAATSGAQIQNDPQASSYTPRTSATLPMAASPGHSVHDGSGTKSSTPSRGNTGVAGASGLNTLSTHEEDEEEDDSDDENPTGGAPTVSMLNPIKIFNQAMQEGPRKTLRDFKRSMQNVNTSGTSGGGAVGGSSTNQISSNNPEVLGSPIIDRHKNPRPLQAMRESNEELPLSTSMERFSESETQNKNVYGSQQLQYIGRTESEYSSPPPPPPHRLYLSARNSATAHPFNEETFFDGDNYNIREIDQMEDEQTPMGQGGQGPDIHLPAGDSCGLTNDEDNPKLNGTPESPCATKNVHLDVADDNPQQNDSLPFNNSNQTTLDTTLTMSEGWWSKVKASTQLFGVYLQRATKTCICWMNVMTREYRRIRRKIDHEKRAVKRRLIGQMHLYDGNEHVCRRRALSIWMEESNTLRKRIFGHFSKLSNSSGKKSAHSSSVAVHEMGRRHSFEEPVTLLKVTPWSDTNLASSGVCLRQHSNTKCCSSANIPADLPLSRLTAIQLDVIIDSIIHESELIDNEISDISHNHRTSLVKDASPMHTTMPCIASHDLDEIQREKAFKRSRNTFFLLIIATGNLAIVYSEFICYALLLLNHLCSASALSLVYPLMVFLWGMLSVPRPSKTFWISLITYTEIVIVIKYIFQFKLFTFNELNQGNMEGPLWLPLILGINKATNYAVFDLLQLLFIFLHRGYLKNNGLWRDDTQSRSDLEQAVSKAQGLCKATTNVADQGKGNHRETSTGIQIVQTPLIVKPNRSSWFKPLRKLHHFYVKMTDPQLNKKVDVYVYMFIMEFLAFLLIIFGYKSFGPSTAIGDSAFEFIRRNRIPVPFISMLVVQFLLILLDRALFLRKNVLGKFIFQVIHVLMIHAWLFFLLPWFTKASFVDTLPPQILYVIKCIYFGLSAYQIRSGYPKSIMGNFLTQNYNYINLIFFKLYLMIPFLYEMRNIMDWIWTDTTLALYHWMEVEDVYAKVFVLKCWRRAEQEYPTPRSVLRYAYIKYSVGLLFLGLCFFCIWTPLVVSSFIGTTFAVNPPVQCKFDVALGSFPSIYTFTARHLQYKDLSKQDMNLLKHCYERDQRSLGYLNHFHTVDITDIRVSSDSSSIWTITPPHLEDLRKQLKDFSEPMHLHFEMGCRRTVKEVGSSEQLVVFNHFRPLLKEERETFIKALQTPLPQFQHIKRVENASFGTHHIQDVGEPIQLELLTPRYVMARRDRMEELPAVSKNWNYVNVSAQLWVSMDKSTGEIWRWWSLKEMQNNRLDYEELCPMFGTKGDTVPQRYRSTTSSSLNPGLQATVKQTKKKVNNITLERGVRILSFNERVFDNIFGKVFSSYGIIGLYAAYIFVVHRILRVLYSDITYIIQYQEMPNVDRILKLCHEIYLVRERRILNLEEELVARLIFLFRSNESLIKYTRHRKRMLLDYSKTEFPPYTKVSAKNFRD